MRTTSSASTLSKGGFPRACRQVQGAEAVVSASRRMVLVASCVAGLATEGYAQTAQWRVQDGGNGHLYELVVGTMLSWHDASAQAQARGGYLATLTSNPEHQFVFDLAASRPDAWTFPWFGPWLGGYQDRTAADYAEPAGGWRWVTGEAWSFAAWGVNDPSNTGGSQDYLAFSGQTSQEPIGPYWNDLQDDVRDDPNGYAGIPSFIVEYNVPSPPACSVAALAAVLWTSRRRRSRS